MTPLDPDDPLTREWHVRYYEAQVYPRWMGVPVGKYPADMLVYAEIIYATKPTLIIETGTNAGGSALWFAHCFDALGAGHVITIDPFDRDDGLPRPQHPRISYWGGSSLDPSIVTQLGGYARRNRTMVVLDSVHAAAHVAAEIDAYARLVTVGCFLVVEDTDLNGHPVVPTHGPGPMEAVTAFLARNDQFVPERNCERFGMTANRNGWLRRVR